MNKAEIGIAYWYKILDYWVNKQGNSGLTLPFLVGVESVFNSKFRPANSSIRDLLKSIVNGPVFEDCISLKYCRDIEAYILGLERRPNLPQPCFINNEEQVTLTVVDDAFSIDSTIDEITNFLESMYLPMILNGTYSRQPRAFGGWSSFNSDDIEQIVKSLAN